MIDDQARLVLDDGKIHLPVLDQDSEAPTGCDHGPARALHACPYHSDVYNDPSPRCTCCDDCAHDCAQDI